MRLCLCGNRCLCVYFGFSVIPVIGSDVQRVRELWEHLPCMYGTFAFYCGTLREREFLLPNVFVPLVHTFFHAGMNSGQDCFMGY